MARVSLLLSSLLVVSLSSISAVAQCTFTKIEIAEGTDPHGEGVNKYDTVVGTFNDQATGRQRGFRWNGGHYTVYNYPGATATSFHGNNDQGAIVGGFSDATGVHGLELFQGTAYVIDFPGAGCTSVRGINASGTIVGTFTYLGKTRNHGFIRSTSGWQVIDYPGSLWTQVNGINVFGDIVGTYSDVYPYTHAFTRSAAGVFKSIDFPGSVATEGYGINRWHSIVGVFRDYLGSTSDPGRGYSNTGQDFYGFSYSNQDYQTGLGGLNNLGHKTGWVLLNDGTGFAFLRVCPGT